MPRSQSTNKKNKLKTNKKKTNKKINKLLNNIASVLVDKVDTVDVVVNTVANVVKETKKHHQKHKHKLSTDLNIHLSVPRVRNHLDKRNINADIEKACNEIRSLHLDGKECSYSDDTTNLLNRSYMEKKYKPDKSTTVDNKLELVSKLRKRFSNTSSVCLTICLDYVIQELVRDAMITAKEQKKSIIRVNHVVNDRLKYNKVYNLVKKLPAVVEAAEPVEAVETVDAVEAVESVEAVEVVEPVELDEPVELVEHSSYSGFEFYVNNICKYVKNGLTQLDEKYNSIRVSKDIRKFCSDVVIQLIGFFSPLILLSMENANVKTINDSIIRFVFEFFLHINDDRNSGLLEFLDSKMVLYNQ